MVKTAPRLLALIEADLDAHGKQKKALRLADAAWMRNRSGTLPECEPDAETVADPQKLVLRQGRPRTSAYVVLVAMMLRGFLGAGYKSAAVVTLAQESVSLRVLFINLGVALPRASTLTELVNAVSNETRLRILDAQVCAVLHLGWDDFGTMLQDSTHVEGNTAWPTDSHTIVTLVARVLRVGSKLDKFGLRKLHEPAVQHHLDVMRTRAREIALAPRTKDTVSARRNRYKKLLWRAGRVHRQLDRAVSLIEADLSTLDVLPSRKMLAAHAVGRLRGDVEALAKTIASCKARIIDEKKVPAADKVFSISDPDAGFIAKGQRVPVIGYKPQLARSGRGFVTGLLLPQGNAADSLQLLPMLEDVVRRTTVTPRVVSVDDGYASKANVEAIRGRNIEVISINGSKGRALTAQPDWDSTEYRDARALRSAVESLIFTLKNGFDFDYVARRGIDAAYAELIEKVLAYNTCRMARMRHAVVAPPATAQVA